MAEKGMLNAVTTSERVVAITFDDGPDANYTPQVLDIFSKAGGKATFFMIGEQMKANPDLVKKTAELGHEIGNHTYTHPKSSQLSTDECKREILQSEELTFELTGKKPVIFRPPYIDYNDETISILEDMGYPDMIGAVNFEARDWEEPGAGHILDESRKSVRNGSILIFHDGYGNRSQTVEAVRVLVSELKEQGYQFVTVSELLQMGK